MLEQMLLRLSRKRTLETLQQAHASDYAEVSSKTLVNSITCVALLARILSPLWQNAARLARVCKRFALATKHREFWMPAVRVHLRSSWKQLTPSFIAYINPFFRFPADVWMCPGWEWSAFLEWLFPHNLLSSIKVTKGTLSGDPQWVVSMTSRARQVLQFRTDIAADDSYLRTAWYMIPKHGEDCCPIFCAKVDAGPNTTWRSSYDVRVNGVLVWSDGQVDGGDRHWCGAVTEISSESDKLTVLEPHGFYRK